MSDDTGHGVLASLDAVRVHLTGSDVPLTPAPAPAPKREGRYSVFHTVSLTADDPAQEILPASTNRVLALVQALDDDVILARTEADAAKLTGATLPKANTSPYPVEHDGALFAAASTFSGTGSVSRVSVTAVYRG